ncbi:cell division protein FtsQ [Zhengella mangrovi]|uniref:Cell division protein FtsQ n=1 Tax=Zhengella mangrovi TaxID=1982044 RepID=A0A2G1QPX5_9HYPH|nr:cell division protein FtsQ/DivIB [Zhengella mangrovi]PHP67586.1 cell division protein FtsQ [Zhengella mangrovi]
MHALRQGQAGYRTEGRAGAAIASSRIVLPRLLRRPMRHAARLVSGDIEVPSHAFGVLTAGFLGATVLYGSVLGGHMPAIVTALASNTGFAISQIDIAGNSETSEIDVMGAIHLDGWTALPGFSPEAARERIAELPWVQEASVQKVYPGTLQVKLAERTPFALWQQGDAISVIEQDGKVIAPYRNGKFAALPLVVGDGAAEKASMFIAGMKRFPSIAGRVKGYVRVADRRWDLILDNGVTVKLPERGELAAVQKLVALQADQGLLDKDIVAIDMRLDERIAVRLSEAAAKERSEKMDKIVHDEKRRGRT